MKSLYEIFVAIDIDKHKQEFQRSFTKFISQTHNFEEHYKNLIERNRIALCTLEFPLSILALIYFIPSIINRRPPKLKPDMLLLLDEKPIMPIEIELILNSNQQLKQLTSYYEFGYFLLKSAINGDELTKLHYFFQFRTMCFALDISERIKNALPPDINHQGNIIFLNCSEDWKLLPEQSIIYRAFNTLSTISNLKSESEILPHINQVLDSISSKIQSFYYSFLLEYFGKKKLSEEVFQIIENAINEKRVQKVIPTEQEAVEELDDSWVKWLIPRQIKALDIFQIKELRPEQLKALEPEQLKALEPEQLKALEPEKIVQLLKSLEPEKYQKILALLQPKP